MADAVNTKQSLTLNWTSCIRISDFMYQGAKERGVYIWGFTISDLFIPYYVGIAGNIASRIYEHVNCIIGGKYTVYHTNSLADFKKFKGEAGDAHKADGKLYVPCWPDGYKSFIDNRKTLQPHIDYMVDTFTFLYAVVDEKISGKDLKEIEKICINQLGRDNLANTRMGDSEKFCIMHNGCGLFN